MSEFIRRFEKIEEIKKHALFEKLCVDVKKGEVFPAIRDNRLDFYYKGGVLFSFDGDSFKRNRSYLKHDGNPTDAMKKAEGNVTEDTFRKGGFISGTFVDNYDAFKKQNEKWSEGNREKALLSKLYVHTFGPWKSDIVVLDIEVRFNTGDNAQKKCDIVLMHTKLNQIMVVEGKLFSDPRMACKPPKRPEVIEQIEYYNKCLADVGEAEICKQYGEHIDIMRELFGATYNTTLKKCAGAKLLVYEVSGSPTDNQKYSKGKIEDVLGKSNIMWVGVNEEPSLEEIWDTLSK